LSPPASPYISSLSLHDALPILPAVVSAAAPLVPLAITAAERRLQLPGGNPVNGGARCGGAAREPQRSGAAARDATDDLPGDRGRDRKSTRLNSSHVAISYAVFC